MKRNMDLIRELLLRLEALPVRAGAVAHLRPGEDEIAIPGHDADEIGFHLDLLREAGLIDDGGFRPNRGVGFRRLTWAGFDFLDDVRDPEIWARTKQGANVVKSWSFETLKEIGKGLIKKQVEEYTGIRIE